MISSFSSPARYQSVRAGARQPGGGSNAPAVRHSFANTVSERASSLPQRREWPPGDAGLHRHCVPIPRSHVSARRFCDLSPPKGAEATLAGVATIHLCHSGLFRSRGALR